MLGNTEKKLFQFRRQRVHEGVTIDDESERGQRGYRANESERGQRGYRANITYFKWKMVTQAEQKKLDS